MRVEQNHRPQKRRSGGVLGGEEEIEQEAADRGVAGIQRSLLPRGFHLGSLPDRFLHPEIGQASRLSAAPHCLLAPLRAFGKRLDKAVDGEPGFSEREARQVKGEFHQSNVKEVVIELEPLPGILAQIRPDKDSLGSVEIHVSNEQTK
uniref:Uncharacterized protein n=1 Tax=Rhizophora mucronata TaxID=61149 RepID=A0A2P2PHZ0_RHIMU